jgi:RNA polymerase primary sigma factor
MSMRQLKITKSITNRESQSLEKYLQEIGKVELISPEEEVKLAIRIKQGDQKALDKLTKANLRFVVSVAKQYQNQGLSLPDLINEGNLGLIKAAQRFDETRGFKFISYAVWWIRQSILQAFAEQSRIVRLPFNKVGLHQPHPESLFATGAGIRARTFGRGTGGSAGTGHRGSLFFPWDRRASREHGYAAVGRGRQYPDRCAGEPQCGAGQLEHRTQGIAETGDRPQSETLTERQKEVICFFFGIGVDHPMSLEDIGEKFNLTRERVRQIKDKAITKLRSNSRSKMLRSYLGI